MHSKALKIDVTQIQEMHVTSEPGGPGVLSCRGAGGRLIDTLPACQSAYEVRNPRRP